jgi:hypothetical protein
VGKQIDLTHLLPPCNVTFIGTEVLPNQNFSTQYDIITYGSVKNEQLWSYYYGSNPSILPHPPLPTPEPGGVQISQTEYEKRELARLADANSCGFVVMSYAFNRLGISSGTPYQFIYDSALNGVNHTIGGGFGYLDFLKSGNGVVGNDNYLNIVATPTNPTPVPTGLSANFYLKTTATVDEIVNFIRKPNTLPMILVLAEGIQSASNKINVNNTELSDSGLLNEAGTIRHWVLVTGVSEDNQWLRILNPLHNQIEYYSRDEISRIRKIYGQNIIVITNQSF